MNGNDSLMVSSDPAPAPEPTPDPVSEKLDQIIGILNQTPEPAEAVIGEKLDRITQLLPASPPPAATADPVAADLYAEVVTLRQFQSEQRNTMYFLLVVFFVFVIAKVIGHLFKKV